MLKFLQVDWYEGVTWVVRSIWHCLMHLKKIIKQYQAMQIGDNKSLMKKSRKLEMLKTNIQFFRELLSISAGPRTFREECFQLRLPARLLSKHSWTNNFIHLNYQHL